MSDTRTKPSFGHRRHTCLIFTHTASMACRPLRSEKCSGDDLVHFAFFGASMDVHVSSAPCLTHSAYKNEDQFSSNNLSGKGASLGHAKTDTYQQHLLRVP